MSDATDTTRYGLAIAMSSDEPGDYCKRIAHAELERIAQRDGFHEVVGVRHVSMIRPLTYGVWEHYYEGFAIKVPEGDR